MYICVTANHKQAPPYPGEYLVEYRLGRCVGMTAGKRPYRSVSQGQRLLFCTGNWSRCGRFDALLVHGPELCKMHSRDLVGYRLGRCVGMTAGCCPHNLQIYEPLFHV